jgi:hypothetical protein
VEAYSGARTENGWARLVRHDHRPERDVITGIDAVRGLSKLRTSAGFTKLEIS